MSNIKDIERNYAVTASGSINYDFYQKRASNIRAESIVTLVKGFFTAKKSSSGSKHKECDVINIKGSDYLNTEKSGFNSKMKAA